ncbi:Mannan endo-1,4-beta-mannosidase [Heracleum sosnowskyi]|uniref:mannan endo-1,4-beta-mannosidase n=1 Tax=Heracleum sosnowskyi TaxID=360622 RepID=A0AAD8HA77_9APIA|nr:Mannan endo-1,4-beta-mannosidase [Heracleum sosnowskyi]
MRHCGMFVLVIFLLHESLKNVSVSAQSGFIKSRGVQFILNGSPYYANGFNAYWLMSVASNPSQRNKVSSTFQEAVSNGLTISRTWAFSDGGNQPLQSSPGVYNEQMFQGLDFVIYEARRRGIKLILSLVNNHGDFGGKAQYVKWAREQGQNISSDDDFYTNSVVKEFYRNHIKTVLSRRNSINGVEYMSDPTVMAWELINEPRCTSDSSGNTMQAWITEMASYLKSIDKDHLLEVEYAPKDKQFNLNINHGTNFITNNQFPEIDFTTIHSYPDQWLPAGANKDSQLSFTSNWINTHIQDSQTVLGKPMLVAEFGWNKSRFDANTRDQLLGSVYSGINTSARRGGAAAGGIIWQLLAEGLDSLRDGYETVLKESPSTAGVIVSQSRSITQVRQTLARRRNMEKGRSEMNT